MQLYLLRHGIAEDKAAKGTDADRELTSKGKAELEQVMKVASRAGVKPSLILTSPLVRARQTAEIARKQLGTKETLLETNTLVPDGPPHMVWAELSDHRKEESLMLVSHNPLIEQLVPFFLNTPTLHFAFDKGAIVAIELGNFRGDPDGLLHWILTPSLAASGS